MQKRVMLLWFLLSQLTFADELKLLFAGDIMAHDVNIVMRDYHLIYKEIKPYLDTHHLNFANFESVLSDTILPQGYPRFSVRSAYAQAAIDAGFNVFSLANNHTADHFHKGIYDSINSWKNLKMKYPWIQYSGLKKAEDAIDFEIIHVKGLRVGYVAITEFLNWQEHQDVGHELVNVLNFRRRAEVDRLITQVKALKNQVDMLIVSYHGGVEYVRSIEEDKFLFFKELVDAGVDIVWAHHPHVIQPWVMYNEGIIINSNGNLISGQTWAIQSHQAESDLAYRGDSLLYSVKVNILDDGLDIKMEHIYAVSNYRKANTGMVIIDLSKLKEYDFLSPAWLAYYERRRILMKPFMDGVIRA